MMVLSSFKSSERATLCNEIRDQLLELKRELEQYDRALAGDLIDAQRETITRLRARRGRLADSLQERLSTLLAAEYSDDQSQVWQHTIHAA